MVTGNAVIVRTESPGLAVLAQIGFVRVKGTLVPAGIVNVSFCVAAGVCS
jgi:hypothetical protein